MFMNIATQNYEYLGSFLIFLVFVDLGIFSRGV
jgi:hypothetical protein